MKDTIELSDEDKKRINGSEFYLHAKKIMKSFESYKPIQVGEVYSVSYVNYHNKMQYVARGGGGSNGKKDKFMVIHKDDGFLFAKRINASGDLSKEIICLTIKYPSESFSLELDSDQAESIIFQDEKSFDPFKQGKELSKKKNKARRINKSKVITYEAAQDAFNFVSSLKIGDRLFDASTAFGEGIVQWEVTGVFNRATDKTPQADWNNNVYAYGNTDVDQKHNRNGFDNLISIEISMVGEPPSNRTWIARRRDVCFVDFLDIKKYRDYYSSRPATIDEV
jgi:hypothetical protein